MEANDGRPQPLRTKSDMDYSRAVITKPELGLDMGVCPRHQWFKRIETGGVVHGKTENEQVDVGRCEGSSNLTSPPEGPNWSPDASPNTEHFPSKQLPAKLHDSIGAIQCLERGIENPHVDLTSSAEFEEFLGFLKSGDTIYHIFDALLVWLYRLELLQYLQSLLLRFNKTDNNNNNSSNNNLLSETTVFLLLQVKPSALDPPQWLLVILGRSAWNGRWLNELSFQWIDTTWRTAFSALHAGSISPVASLPRVSPARLKALWAAAVEYTRLPTPPPSPAPDASVPCRARASGRKRPTPVSAALDGAGPGKKRKQGQGAGRGKKVADDPGEGSSDRGGSGGGGGGDGEEAKPDDAVGRPFACHYYKLSPLAYAGCLFHHQTQPRHVKRHLLRNHKQPIHCPTCYREFGARAACDRHIVTRNCEPPRGSNPWSDRISEDIERNLHALPAGEGPKKWFEMWDALFPGVPRPSSPYVDPRNYESAIIASVGEHTAPAFRNRLEERFPGEQVGEIMGLFAQTLGTESPSAAAAVASSGTDPGQAPPPPSDPQPPAGGAQPTRDNNVNTGGDARPPSPVPPADEEGQAGFVSQEFVLLQFQRQQQEDERQWRMQQYRREQARVEQLQQRAQEQVQRQQQLGYQYINQMNSPRGPFQGGVATPTVHPPPQFTNSTTTTTQQGAQQGLMHQAMASPTHTHGDGAYGSLHRSPVQQSAHNVHQNQTNTDPTEQQTFNSAHDDFGVQENSQFPDSDTRSSQTLASQRNNQNMVHDNTLSRLVNPRDLQLHRSTQAAARTSEFGQPSAAGSVQQASAPPPTGHRLGSEEENQGSPEGLGGIVDDFGIPYDLDVVFGEDDEAFDLEDYRFL